MHNVHGDIFITKPPPLFVLVTYYTEVYCVRFNVKFKLHKIYFQLNEKLFTIPTYEAQLR
jgi:hypothetical protein